MGLETCQGPIQSSPHFRSHVLKIHLYTYTLFLQCVSTYFLIKILYEFLVSPCALHIQLTILHVRNKERHAFKGNSSNIIHATHVHFMELLPVQLKSYDKGLCI